MATECSEPRFDFQPLGAREITGRFDGGTITSDGGGVLLREVEAKTGMLAAFARCFDDFRDPELIEHTVEELLKQRIFALDLDATDDPLHGHQAGRFFHGYYDSYCYLPLYIFCGEQLLGAKLRPSDIDGAAGSVQEVARIVAQIRQRWPHVQIILRAGSGFCREPLMRWRRCSTTSAAGCCRRSPPDAWWRDPAQQLRQTWALPLCASITKIGLQRPPGAAGPSTTSLRRQPKPPDRPPPSPAAVHRSKPCRAVRNAG
jgi:hypothetical protein